MDLIASERVLHIFNSEPGRNAVLSIKRLINIYEAFHKKPLAVSTE
jgi:pre-mRNA-splicing factor 18